MKIPILIVGGVTASGKSNLALDLAKSLNGVILNGDSLQIYKGLPLLTAAPDLKQTKEGLHRLYGVLPPHQPCTVAIWQNLVLKEISSAHALGKVPIVVGGTGLYLQSLVKDFSEFPEISPEIRQKARREYEILGAVPYHERLKQVDAKTAKRIHASDGQRCIRAWEIFLQTGTPLSVWQSQKKTSKIDHLHPIQILLLPDRLKVYRQAEKKRFMHMIQTGALEEVRFLMDTLSKEQSLYKALGFEALSDHLRGNLTLEEAVETSLRDTRRYIKRQYTWFRNQVQEAFIIHEIYESEKNSAILENLINFLKEAIKN